MMKKIKALICGLFRQTELQSQERLPAPRPAKVLTAGARIIKRLHLQQREKEMKCPRYTPSISKMAERRNALPIYLPVLLHLNGAPMEACCYLPARFIPGPLQILPIKKLQMK